MHEVIPDTVLGEFAVVLAGTLIVMSVGEFVVVNDIIMVAIGDLSVGDPFRKRARHTTSVPLYCSSAGMVSVYAM